LVTANKYNGKYSVHVDSSPNKMALTNVNVLEVQQTRFCSYSLQNVLLLAHMIQVCVTMEQYAAKDCSQRPSIYRRPDEN
jgi:hypothetical protein